MGRWALPASLLAAGCGRAPASIRIDVDAALFDREPHPIEVRAADGEGRPLPDVPVVVTARPPGRVRLSATSVQCVSDGAVELRAARRGVSATRTLRCRNVVRCDLPEDILLVAAGPCPTYLDPLTRPLWWPFSSFPGDRFEWRGTCRDASGDPMPLAAVHAAVEGDGLAVEAGAVVATGPGQSLLRIESGAIGRQSSVTSLQCVAQATSDAGETRIPVPRGAVLVQYAVYDDTLGLHVPHMRGSGYRLRWEKSSCELPALAPADFDDVRERCCDLPEDDVLDAAGFLDAGRRAWRESSAVRVLRVPSIDVPACRGGADP